MYQSQQLYGQPAYRPGCGCFGGAGYTQPQVVPDPYAYDQYGQYNQYGQYPGVGLTTSVVTPAGIGAPIVPQVGVMPGPVYPNPVETNALYHSRTIQAPPIVNKAVVAPPACKTIFI